MQPCILLRMTNRVLRSTTVPTADRLKAPLIKSPSQCPGTRRASMSSGRLIIRNVSGTIADPAKEVRRAPRLGLPQRLNHQRLQSAPWLSVDRSIDRLVTDALTRVVWMHAP